MHVQVSEKGLHVHLTPRVKGFVPLICVAEDIEVLFEMCRKVSLVELC